MTFILYIKYGKEFIYCGKRGGRNNYNLTPNEESKFLKKYESISIDGNMITATSIHNDLEDFLSKSLHKSGIYKMLKRPHSRKFCYGETPYQIFLDSTKLPKRKIYQISLTIKKII